MFYSVNDKIKQTKKHCIWQVSAVLFRGAWKRLSLMQPFMNLGPLRLQTGIKPYKCLFSMPAAIRIVAHGSAWRGAGPQMPFHGVQSGFLASSVFSLRSQQRAGLHKSDDRICWFCFQGITRARAHQTAGCVNIGQRAPVRTFAPASERLVKPQFLHTSINK